MPDLPCSILSSLVLPVISCLFRLWFLEHDVNRWVEVVTHVPCGGDDIDSAGRVNITGVIEAIDGPEGTAGIGTVNSRWNECNIVKTGTVKLDIDDIDNWSEGAAFNIMLHEVGHVLGIG